MQLCLTCAANENASSMPINAAASAPVSMLVFLRMEPRTLSTPPAISRPSAVGQPSTCRQQGSCPCPHVHATLNVARKAMPRMLLDGDQVRSRRAAASGLSHWLDHAWIKVQALRIDVTVVRSIQCPESL